MKRIIFIVVIILIPGLCFAGPFVRCAAYTTGILPDYFKVRVDLNPTPIQSAPYTFPGETGPALHHDLAALAPGQHLPSYTMRHF